MILILCAPKNSFFSKLLPNPLIVNSPVLDFANIFILFAFSFTLFIVISNFPLYYSNISKNKFSPGSISILLTNFIDKKYSVFFPPFNFISKFIVFP